MKRLFAFMNPWGKFERRAAIRLCRAIRNRFGRNSRRRFCQRSAETFLLAYPYSDFIFAVVGEELGLVGTLAVVAAFTFLLWRGARAALNAPDRFGMLLGIGLITGIIVQALFNISVVVSILPGKGIPLPLFPTAVRQL
jgi:cell division protein FtsW